MVSYFSSEYKIEDPTSTGAGRLPRNGAEGGDESLTNETTTSGIAFLVDLHAHAAKRGCFLYGNRLKSAKLQAEILLYARLTSANSAFMDFDACCFSQVTYKNLE